MKTIIRFLKPHKMLCFLTLLLAFIDVFGALIIPTYTAEMMNAASSGSDLRTLTSLCIKMLIAAALSGAAMLCVCRDDVEGRRRYAQGSL